MSILSGSPRHIALMGPQGAGKGTQVERLADHLHIPAVATGEICRTVAASQTLVGEQIAAYINQGKLVPDEIINALVDQRLAAPDCQAGVIFDGYPRTVAQAKRLEDTPYALTHAILLELDERVALQRISGRERCGGCGAIYHVTMNPPQVAGRCDHCGGVLAVRHDDQYEQSILQRFKIYHEQIGPLVAYYEAKGILYRVNADHSIEEVTTAIEQIFTL